jgi:hypothetical protein
MEVFYETSGGYIAKIIEGKRQAGIGDSSSGGSMRHSGRRVCVFAADSGCEQFDGYSQTD